MSAPHFIVRILAGCYGGGNAEVTPGPGSGLGGDAYGFGATSSFLNWLYSITPEGEDHLA